MLELKMIDGTTWKIVDGDKKIAQVNYPGLTGGFNLYRMKIPLNPQDTNSEFIGEFKSLEEAFTVIMKERKNEY